MAISIRNAALGLVALTGLLSGCKHHGESSCGYQPCQTAGTLHVKPSPCGKPDCFVTQGVTATSPTSCGKTTIAPTTVTPAVPATLPNSMPKEMPIAPKSKVMLPNSSSFVSLPIPTTTEIVMPPLPGQSPIAGLPAIQVPSQPAIQGSPLEATPVAKTLDRGHLPRLEGNAKSNRAINFSWIVGEIFYSNAKKTWIVRYAGLDVDDDFGGSVTIVGADHLLEGIENGQLVRIEGELQDRDNKSISPAYRVNSLKRVN